MKSGNLSSVVPLYKLNYSLYGNTKAIASIRIVKNSNLYRGVRSSLVGFIKVLYLLSNCSKASFLLSINHVLLKKQLDLINALL